MITKSSYFSIKAYSLFLGIPGRFLATVLGVLGGLADLPVRLLCFWNLPGREYSDCSDWWSRPLGTDIKQTKNMHDGPV